MNPAEWAVAFSIGVFVAMVACLEVGYRVGRQRAEKTPGGAHDGIHTIETAVFGLLGLLLAFSFAAGISRFDARHQLIVTEANAIGTAYLRLDLLPINDQPELRQLFRTYLDTRLRAYEQLPDLEAAEQELGRAAAIQQKIWSRAVTDSQGDPSQTAARLLLPAINEMIDITTARTLALHQHLPALIFALLVGISLLSGLLAGYAMAKRRSRSWLHVLLYAVVVAVTIFTVLDLEYPRFGLIRLDAADKALIELRDSIR